MTSYIGIDPGLTGAVALIRKNGEVAVWDTPTTIIKKGKTTKTDYLPYEMARMINDILDEDVHVIIEKVHAMPAFGKDKNGNDKRQGITSMFRFGEGFGLWLGIIAAFELPMTQVAPQTWKKALMKDMPDKDAARQRAQELFPMAVKELSRKKDCGRADAILLAEFGRRMDKGV